MAQKYHVAWLPGAGNLGDTFKLNWDGDEPNVAAIEFVVQEIADDSDPAGAGTTLIATIKGAIAAKKLTVSTITPNPALTRNAAEITLECGGKTQKGIKLLALDRENGMFELQVDIKVGGKKVASSTTAYVRYEAFAPRPAGVTGPVVAFITGTDGFSISAALFWHQHADTVIEREAMSLEEIVAWLRSHQQRYGSYGEVNIITHGNERNLMIRLFDETSDPRMLNVTRLNERLHLNQTPPPPQPAFAGPIGLRADSRVVFRACNAGNNPDLVAAIRKHIFRDACLVYVPLYLQAYDTRGGAELFYEQLRYFSPTVQTAPAQEAKMRSIFQSRYPSANWATERGTFTNRNHAPQSFILHVGPVNEAELYSDLDKGTKKSTADVDKIADAYWTAKGYDRLDETFNTRFTDWGVRTRAQTPNPSNPSTSRHWIEGPPAQAKPAITLVNNAGRTLTIGKSSSSDIVLTGTGVADDHLELKLTGGFHFIADATGGDITVSGSTIPKGGKFTGDLGTGSGFSIKVGSVTLTVRGERPLTLDYDLQRHQYDRRRILRDSSPYASANNVVPTVSNPTHYTKKP
jgi:hypothetical protein